MTSLRLFPLLIVCAILLFGVVNADQLYTGDNDAAIFSEADGTQPAQKSQMLRGEIPYPAPFESNGRDCGGGPDEFGYRWVDSDDDHVDFEYDWIEINQIGDGVSLRDDQTAGWFDIGFDFTFYGRTYDRVKICSNGFITFGSGNSSWDHRNRDFPDRQEPKNVIAPLWLDLDPDREEVIYYWGDENSTMFVVEWDNVPVVRQPWYFPDGHEDDDIDLGPKKFQLILRNDDTIVFQYYDDNAPMTQGVIGIQNLNGEWGMTVAANEEYTYGGLATLIGANFGVVTGTVTDLATGDPIAGATVNLVNQRTTTTDNEGVYWFNPVWGGDYEIDCSANLFVGESSGEFSVAHAETSFVDFALEAAIIVAGEEYDTPGTANNVFILGSLLYVADGASGLRIWDLSDQDNITEIGSVDTDGEALAVYVVNNIAYVADGSNGLVLVDVSDPENPSIISNYDSPGVAYYVYVLGSYAYLADGENGLLVIDISDPQNPTLVGSYDTPGSLVYVYAVGTTVYAADMEGGFFIIDVSDPENPNLTGSYDTQNDVYSFNIVGHYVYIVDGVGGLLVLDFADLENIIEAGSYETPGAVVSVFIQAGYLYLIDDENGFYLLDISDPEEPVLVTHYEVAGALWIIVIGDYAYIAYGDGGFLVVDCSNMTGAPLTINVTSPDDADQFLVGDNMEFRWSTNARYGVDHYTLYYSTSGGDRWIEIETIDDPNVVAYDWEIPELYSADFWVRVSCWDSRNNRINANIGPMTVAATEVDANIMMYGWNLISVPLNAADPTPEAIIGDDIDGIFAVYGFDYWDPGFFVAEELTPGPGYWLVVPYDTSAISMDGVANLDTVVIDLDLVWNLVGCPFPTAVQLSDVVYRYEGQQYTLLEAAAEGLIVPVLYGYRHELGYFESTTLTPWYGYWHLSSVTGLQMLIPPPEPLGNGGQGGAPEGGPGRDEGTSQDTWEVTIITEIDEVSDAITVFGTNVMATDGFDANTDFPEPIPLPEGNWIKAFFSHGDWMPDAGDQFNRDIKAPMNGEMKTWDLTVLALEAGEVTLTWPSINNKPLDGFEYALINPLNNDVINMLNEQSYTFEIGADEPYLFEINVTAPLSVSDEGSPIANEFGLLATYPNPFNSTLTVGFALPGTGHVSLGVYDLSGHLVSSLVNEIMTGGSHTVTWNSEDAPTGVYFVRINADGLTASHKIIMLK